MKIKEAIRNYNRKKFIPRLRLGLSQIGHPCQQYLLNKYQGIPEEFLETTNQLTFDIGNFIESKLIEIINDMEEFNIYLKTDNKELSLKFGDIELFGHVDGIVYNKHSSISVWECKTMNQKAFNNLLKYGYENYSPEYRAQLHSYMMATGLQEAYVNVFCKNTSQVYQEIIEYNEEYIVSLLTELSKLLNKEINPDRECIASNYWKVKYCGYGGLCFA